MRNAGTLPPKRKKEKKESRFSKISVKKKKTKITDINFNGGKMKNLKKVQTNVNQENSTD